MRLLSSQIRYAICGMFDLAYNAESQPVQLRVIGERQHVPPRYLEQIFQRLRKAGLVHGKRGPGGGYVLARKPAEITLYQVVEAVEGPVEIRVDARGETGLDAEASREYVPGFLWASLSERFAAVLIETTLEDLCQDAARNGVRRVSAEYLSYQI